MGDTDPNGPLPATCLVLAGGRSTRFGSDKLDADWDGRTLLAHTVDRLSPWFADTVVVHAPGRRPAGLPPAARTAADFLTDGGPLVGLTSGLEACTTEWAFAVAADMPFVARPLIDLLWSRTRDADVVVPAGPRGLEPLCAFYRVSVAPRARSAAEAHKRRVIAFFGDVRVVEVAEADVRAVDPGLRSFFNINTVEDFQAAVARGAEREGAKREGAGDPLQDLGPSTER